MKNLFLLVALFITCLFLIGCSNATMKKMAGWNEVSHIQFTGPGLSGIASGLDQPQFVLVTYHQNVIEPVYVYAVGRRGLIRQWRLPTGIHQLDMVIPPEEVRVSLETRNNEGGFLTRIIIARPGMQ